MKNYTNIEIEAMKKALEYIGLESDEESIKNHIESGVLSLNMGRNGCLYVWAIWNPSECLVNVNTGKLITDERFIKAQFC